MKQKVSNSYEVDGIRYMECSCGREVKSVGDEAVSVKCSMCVNMVMARDYPVEKSKSAYSPTGRPVGWHWMSEFVDVDGNVFHKGKEQPKLKGTLKPTKVIPCKKKTKRRTKQQMLLAMDKERKVALKKAIKKQKDFLNHKLGEE